MTRIDLAGCRTRPIGSYLKALGVLRLVGEQLDPAATGSWVGDTFRLDADVDEDRLVDFFADTYAPTPLVSPWNGGSGFAPKDKAAIGAIESILGSTSERFDGYREAIGVARKLVADPSWDSGGKNKKQHQIARCRAELPDEAVAWLDSSVVLANDRAVFPPLFGTGGNDGRLEFSSNFMQHLVSLLITPRKRSAPSTDELLRAALFGEGSALEKGTSGQYDPNSVDPPVTSASGRSESLSNPWDFILLIEGGLVFASAAARRLGATASIRAAMPFCVDSSAVGSASAAEGEETRGEIWAPIWMQPSTTEEVARLIGEGRAEWGREQASNGVDFAKAVATLGVDRGIDRFVRHGIVQRYGLTFLAVPLGDVAVGARPEVNVLLQVDLWLRYVRRQLPGAVATARRRIEAAQFRVATDLSNRRQGLLQQVLVELADLELAIARSAGHVDVPMPVGGRKTRLPASDWLPHLDDGSPEFRLAASLASARDRLPSGEIDGHTARASSLALFVRPVRLDSRGNLEWSPGPPRIPGVERHPIQRVLVDVLVDREIRGGQRARSDATGSSDGIRLGFDFGLTAESSDLLDLAEGRIDLDRLGNLLRGLILLDWRRRDTPAEPTAELYRPPFDGRRRRTSPAMAVLLPFFHGQPILAQRGDGADIVVDLEPRPGWPKLLASGHADRVLADAVHRLRIAGLRPAVEHVHPTNAEADGALALATLCRTSAGTARQYVRQTCPSDSQIRESATSSTEPTKETT